MNIAINICGPAKEFHGSVMDAKRLATHVKALKHFDLVTAMLYKTIIFFHKRLIYRAVACFWPPVSRIWHTLAVLSC